MRSVVLSCGISLDGYIARPDGAVDFLFMPKDFSMAEFMASIDAAIMGRKTLDVAMQMSGGKYKPEMPTYVFSRKRAPGMHDGCDFVNTSPSQLIEKLRRKPGKDIWLMGGGELAREFLRAGLVDAMHLGVVPVLLGEGIPLFPPGFGQQNFELVENRTYSQGLVMLKYTKTR